MVAPGRRVTLAAPHIYSTPGRRELLATVISGGCFPGQSATAQGAVVNVAPQGSPPQPLVTTPPVALNVGQAVPELPGLGELPTGSVTVPTLPGVDVPALPSIPSPSLPSVPAPPPAPVTPAARASQCHSFAQAISAARCRNIYRWFSRTRTAERKAKAALLCLLNAERRRHGLRALRANARLARAAKAHSRTMVQQRFFAHVGPGRSSPTARLYAARYLPGRGGWAIGENLGFGTGAMTRPISIHQAWMHSTLHRAAMLSPRFREVGFGLYPGIPFQSRGATFTANFATRR